MTTCVESDNTQSKIGSPTKILFFGVIFSFHDNMCRLRKHPFPREDHQPGYWGSGSLLGTSL